MVASDWKLFAAGVLALGATVLALMILWSLVGG